MEDVYRAIQEWSAHDAKRVSEEGKRDSRQGAARPAANLRSHAWPRQPMPISLRTLRCLQRRPVISVLLLGNYTRTPPENGGENVSQLQLLLRPREAAEALAISERSLWTLAASGQITPIRIGKSVRYSTEELERYVSEKLRRKAK